ncbi:hypothetical protein BRC96_08135 [Halobacteriales archaeon QS_6_64_34]|nr:MAG: hypothetical protein BRC96_08135 [Halobacteriales archaeon QS_6_64_34]
MTDKDISQMADEYLSSIDDEVDESHKEELRGKIEQGEEKYERLVQEHGKDHRLAKKAEEVLETRRSELNKLEEQEEQLGTAREEFLQEVANEFELNEHWLQTDIVEAVTHTLVGKKESSYKLFGEEIQGLEDMEGLDEFDRIERVEVVILLAKDGLDQSEKVSEQWERLKDSKSYNAFEAVAEHGTQTPKEVAEKLDESKGVVNGWLKNPTNKWDRLIPFYRPKKGEYGLSTTGQYFREHYYEDGDIETDETEIEEDKTVDKEEDSSEATEAQTTLGATATQSSATTDGDEDCFPR